jgi:hypothetical protein
MERVENVRNMTAQDLAVLGLEDLAYLRAVSFEGAEGFGIFAADGTQVAFAPTRALAEFTVREHNLEPVSVH